MALFYAAKQPTLIRKYLPALSIPLTVRIAAISGDEYGGSGVKRNGTPIKTLWGDIFWQLGVYDEFQELDMKAELPSLDDIRRALEGDPVLVLLDELPSYLRVAAAGVTECSTRRFSSSNA